MAAVVINLFYASVGIIDSVMPGLREPGNCIGTAGDNLVYQLCVDEGNGHHERDNNWPIQLLALRQSEWGRANARNVSCCLFHVH